MPRNPQLIVLALVLLVAESASFWKLKNFMAWGYEGLLPYIVALSFNALLLGGLIALAQDLSTSMRRRIRAAGAVLFLTQAVANVLLVFEQALIALPLEVPTRLLGIDPDSALKLTAVVEGSVLSCVSLLMWQVLGELMLIERQEARIRRQTVKDALAILEQSPIDKDD